MLSCRDICDFCDICDICDFCDFCGFGDVGMVTRVVPASGKIFKTALSSHGMPSPAPCGFYGEQIPGEGVWRRGETPVVWIGPVLVAPGRR
jgi:hypothetical protein